MPAKHRPRTHWILYDARACDGKGSGDASVLVTCGNDAEARTYAGDYGDMACYSYTPEEGHDSGPRTVFDERWEWNWLVDGGFSGTRIAEEQMNRHLAEYGNEAQVSCNCGDANFVSGELLDSGTQGATPNGPAVHWFEATLKCKCGRSVHVNDSD